LGGTALRILGAAVNVVSKWCGMGCDDPRSICALSDGLADESKGQVGRQWSDLASRRRGGHSVTCLCALVRRACDGRTRSVL